MRDEMHDVVDELRKVKRLLSILVTKGLKQREQIHVLSRVGFSPKEIAELIGTTPNTVSVTLAQIRKQSAKSKQSAKEETPNDQ
jgi:DNA-binding CsgD family transcriptional regulator